MFKKLFFLMVGAGFGFGVSFWLMRVVKETVDRYTPDRVRQDLVEGLRVLGQELAAAVREGREAMREREEELLAELEAAAGGSVPAPGGPPPTASTARPR